MNFQEAYTRLHQIYTQLQSDELVDVDTIVQLQAEAEKLYTLCQEKLANVNKK